MGSVCEKQGQYKVCGTAQCLPCADSSCQAEMKNRRQDLKAFKRDCPPGYKKARNRDRGFAAAWGPGIHNYNVCEFSGEGKATSFNKDDPGVSGVKDMLNGSSDCPEGEDDCPTSGN